MKNIQYQMIALCLLFLVAGQVQGQDAVDKKQAKKEAKAAKKNKVPEKGDIYLSPLPVIGANPALGFIYGAGLAASWYMGDPKTTKISSALAGLAFTTLNQTVFTIKSTAYTENNNIILMGDWRFLNSSQPTWGLGTGPQSAKLVSNGFEFNDGISEGIDGAQMMEYKFIRFYQTALKKVNEGFYAGIGIHFDRFYDVNDQLLDVANGDITSYYAYNEAYGFDNESTTLVGLSLNGIYDTRDNQNNPYKGRYAYASFKMNPAFIGSEKSSTTLWLEYRDYFSLTPDNHKNILAFWTWGNFSTSGDLPYLLLPAIGYDQFAKSGRPYAQGRFRGQNMVYAETEFRRHVWGTDKNPDLIGMIAYFNITTASASDNDIKLFGEINKGYGLGVRINISKKARTNLGVDYGWGDYGTQGVYIRLNETF
ncbi:outer membrane protein assembly factor [Reichenbachiella carrageenanivorans]|uniref:Outer membrane protein assembly factor n=1 Tax=Reichenbachiella carrageenanivorans TaxID=2979869 RepID=A0ABY6CYZ0_9BACT|nr:outer membrane protein assembly factor [Reichenbachiella carrageenanivorans]UXX79139.1 outer membrane protein assembly factor [Reichenbachiella carrageenanivorans]